MIKEFDRVYLTEDLPDTPFIKGDVGVVAFVYEENKGYELEFFAVDGSTLGVETVLSHQVKSCAGVKSVIHIHGIAA